MKGPAMFTTILSAIVAISLIAPLPQSVVNRVTSQLSDIDWEDGDKGGHCTGVQVGIRWVLTAEHCLPPKDINTEVLINGVPVRIVKRDAPLDLALLETTSNSEVGIIEIRSKPPLPGEQVTAIGFGIGPRLEGENVPAWVLSRTVARVGINGYIFTDGTFIGGMSGGPVVDVDGKLVGLVRQGWDTLNIGGVIPASAIRDFLK